MLMAFRSLWAYRGFILGSVQRDFLSRYRHSLLGVTWAIIHPLAMVIVYTVVFSQVMKAKLPGVQSGFGYSIYLCAGLLTWGLFAEMIGKGQNIFIDHANLLKKINFPRLTLPVIMVLNAAINFGIIFSIFLLFLLISGHWPGWMVLAVFPVLLVEIFFALGLGMVLGVANVFIRDIGHFFGIFLQFWFWLTPIVYPIDILPAYAREWLWINPMMSLVSAYQDLFVRHQMPDWLALVWPLFWAALFCAWAWRLYSRNAGEMMDEL